MTYPPIFHLRCTLCHAASLAVGGFDPQYACPTCARLDLEVQVDWLRSADWLVIHVFTRDRTPWIDAPGYVERLFPVQAAKGFLERLAHAHALDQKYHSYGASFAAPGLSRTRTRHHVPWCPTHTDRFAPCDEACQEVVTYAPVATAPN